MMGIHLGLVGFSGTIIYCVAIVVFFLSVFWKPELALYLMLPLAPLQSIRYRLHEYPLGHSFIDIMLLATVLGLLVKGDLHIPKIPMRLLLIVIAAYGYLSLWKGSMMLDLPLPLWFSDYRMGNWKNNLLVPTMVYFIVFMAIKDLKQIKILILLICCAVFLLNRTVYNTTSQRDYSSFSYDTRAETGGLSSNSLAAIEVQVAFFLLGLRSFEERRWARNAYLGLALFSIYCVMYSFSRGAYAALLIAWVMLGIMRHRVLLILLAVFLCVWQVVVPTAVMERVLMTYEGNKQLESSAEARVTVWEDALKVASTDPLFGMGYNTYEFMHRVGGYTDTHNVYVKVLVETGVIGLALFLAMMGALFWHGYSLYKSAADPYIASLGLGLALWMVCAIITNLFGDRWNYFQLNGYLWTIAAIVSRARMIDAETSEEEEAAEDTDLADPLIATS
jgi:putative inorganic carbon (hco3(-)) transporter